MLFNLLTDRYERRAILVTTNLASKGKSYRMRKRRGREPPNDPSTCLAQVDTRTAAGSAGARRPRPTRAVLHDHERIACDCRRSRSAENNPPSRYLTF